MKKIALILLLSVLGGCDGTFGEKGYIWCNNRFIKPDARPFSTKTGTVAQQGYMYALASALTLQADNREGNAHKFYPPKYLEVIDKPDRKHSGFEAATFLRHPLTPGGREEIIIAFAGSNDAADWVGTNLLSSITQYSQAMNYTLKMLDDPRVYDLRMKGAKVVVTGISLGGGLAVHVVKSRLTGPFIDEAWAFNPSPKIYANSDPNDKIWLVASDGEFLSGLRKERWSFLIAGWGNIGAKEKRTVDNFNLIESNGIYAHYRWGIARQMLFAADYMEYKDVPATEPPRPSEPLKILNKSEFKSCEGRYKEARFKQPDMDDVASNADSPPLTSK
ncbi:hypothetical protein [Pseudomonas sp. G5(2012)]|uniref:hypothetical protein n=1 Tax=Pseudomonas sp. G5(2012) TaxID=1268068 RepID=UPI00034312D0|nr:hypothetical protein [Pseudomonas sp. G5(2012)]EPA99476.1 hypothetical protein PG5_02830 [Pseudomonas sp. G5(2012)]